MILMIDNYDSFTFNLVHVIRCAGHDVQVARHDAFTVEEALARRPDGIIISPGPGRPVDSGISADLVRRAVGEVPILGVCLGHQVIAEVFGGHTRRAPSLVHGKTSLVTHDGRGVFEGVPDPTRVMRYHSLIVSDDGLSEELHVSARVDDAERVIMGLRHRDLPIESIQFHPESFLTPDGPRMIENFLSQRVSA